MAQERSGFDLQEDESLPWLEPADEGGAQTSRLSPQRIVALVAAALLLATIVIGGYLWLDRAPRGGDGALITAPRGDYKVPPADADAREFEGEGDASYAASEGSEPAGVIDPARAPERPAITTGDERADAPSQTPVAANAPAVIAPPATPVATGGIEVQLGAFGSRARADRAWASLRERVGELGPHTPAISTAIVAGGTVYRLRSVLPSRAEAERVCAIVRDRGENCIIIG